jgi:hypothetical protein
MTNTQYISKFERDFQIISLDTSLLALQGEVHSIMFSNDIFAIHTPNRLSLFDSLGNYLRDIGRQGMANNEYIRLNGVFCENNFYKMYDIDGRKIMKFNINGDFIDSKPFHPDNEYSANRITSFFDGYITLVRYRGEFVETPSFGLFDKNLTLKETTGKSLTSGLSLHKVFSQYQNEMLYWNIFDYYIYSIDKDFFIKPKYFIDFHRYSIPGNIYRSGDVERIIEYTHQNITDVIVCVQHVIEQASYLSFIFSKDPTNYLAIFNKESREVKIYELQLSEDFMFLPFLAVYRDNYVLCGVDVFNPLSNLKILLIKQDLLQ